MEEIRKHGGFRSGAGRKKGSVNKGEHKTGRIVMSCLESQEIEIKRLAEQSGKTVSQFILDCIFNK